MSKKYRKVLAAILAATMVLGSGVVANAADGAKGSGTGNADLNIVENLQVFSVVLPVTPAEGQFDYILDPTGVIQETNAEKYGGASESNFTGSGTMFFANPEQKGTQSNAPMPYSNESDPINAYNKSNIAVEIKVTAKLSTPSEVTIATDTLVGDTSTQPKLYLAVKDTSGPKAITVAGIEATSSIATATNAYETKWVEADGEYVKQLKAEAKDLKPGDAGFNTYFSSYSFTLTGDCNAQGNWRGLTDELPTVTLVWTIEKPAGAVDAPVPSALSKKTISASANIIDVTGATVTELKLIKPGTTAELTCGSNVYSFANGKLNVVASMLSGNVGGKLKVVLSTGVTEEVTIQ